MVRAGRVREAATATGGASLVCGAKRAGWTGTDRADAKVAVVAVPDDDALAPPVPVGGKAAAPSLSAATAPGMTGDVVRPT